MLEVFKHDPLFAWMGDPDKMQRAQGGLKLSSDHHNMAQDKADRVLGKIRAKLKDDLGVEYTVNHLVLKATDPVNLATIYHGMSAAGHSLRKLTSRVAFVVLDRNPSCSSSAPEGG